MTKYDYTWRKETDTFSIVINNENYIVKRTWEGRPGELKESWDFHVGVDYETKEKLKKILS